MNNILIVEDDPVTRKILCAALEKHNFHIITAANGSEAFSHLGKYDISAILLDLNLPDIGGLEILKQVRTSPVLSSVAVIIVTENDDKLEAILGLEMGADDYITKPFHQRELIARLNAVLRRTQQTIAKLHSFIVLGDLYIDVKKRTVRLKDKPVDLSFKEFEILVFLAANAGEVISRETIMNVIGGLDYSPETRTVDMHISSIRKKLNDTRKVKNYIDTVSGVGYRFRK